MIKYTFIFILSLLVISCQDAESDSELNEDSTILTHFYQEKIDSLLAVEIELEKERVTFKAMEEPQERIDSMTNLIWEVLDLSAMYKKKLEESSSGNP